MNKNYISAIILILSFLPFAVTGQNNTSSPYSKFGIGELANVGYGRNLALGGTGLGLRNPYHINLKNPASLTSIDTLNFLYETGVDILRTKSESVDYDEYYWDGNLTHITLAHRISNKLMSNVGILPYSNIGYRIRTTKSVEGKDTYVVTDWIGSGGINKMFFSLAYKLSDKFSLGAEFSSFFGTITETRKSWALIDTDNPVYYYTNSKYNAASVKGAFQYYTPLGDNGSNLTLGGYFSPGMKLTGESEILIMQQYGSSILDTAYNDVDDAESIYIPISFGAGIGYSLKGKYLFTADYEMAYWDAVNDDKYYKTQSIYSVGFEIMPQNSLNYFKRCGYRFGCRYDSGYIFTKGYSIDDFRISFGIGLPIMKTESMVNLTLEAGERGTTKMGLIRERYVKMTAAFSFQDFWFIARKLN